MEHTTPLHIPEEEIYLTTKDFLVTGETFSLVWNGTKQMLETVPQPPPDLLGKYYQSAEYISHTDSKKGLVSLLYQAVKNHSLKRKLKLVQRMNNGIGSLLDVGTGTGDFLKEAQKKGWAITGVEVSEVARKRAAEKEIDLVASMDMLPATQYDVVTLWHVLEHLPHLEEAISSIEQHVKSGGTLIVAVPNFKSYDARHYQKYWAAYDVPRHLWHFSRKSMGILFSPNMKLVQIKPMIFDAFYVSLLSEKYKTGHSFSLKGIWTGLRSNLSAWRSKEYSSLIYIFKKA